MIIAMLIIIDGSMRSKVISRYSDYDTRRKVVGKV